MIRNKTQKLNDIKTTIKARISDINRVYRIGPDGRFGPDFYFYKRTLSLRLSTESVDAFASNDYNLEMVYATLVAWDMNSRGAKLKYFDDFKRSVLSCLAKLVDLEALEIQDGSIKQKLDCIADIYENLHVMKTGGRLVSNSKLLHFLFPKLCIPMDSKNTLKYFYGYEAESGRKYMEIMQLGLEVMGSPEETWDAYLDDGWNATIPKLIDNAVLLLAGNSLSKRKNLYDFPR
jgi:hypothetical protein